MALLIRQLREMKGWNDMMQRAAGCIQTLVCCSEDKASVHGTPALPTELVGTPECFYL